MARRVKSASLDSRTARQSLEVRDKPHYVALDRGTHLGYRKGRKGGRWVVRVYVNRAYTVETFGKADDMGDADGAIVLDFWQAQTKARRLASEIERRATDSEAPSGPYTVQQCVADYFEHLRADGKTASDAETRSNALILPELGKIECAKLTAAKLRSWHRGLANKPARLRTRPGQEQQYRELSPGDTDAQRQRKSSANRTLTILKASLNHAWSDGCIPSDQAWRRVKPFRGVDAARARYLTVKEALRLVNACADDMRVLVQGALTTGARYGELAALDVRDYDRDNGMMHVRQSKSGKGRHVVLNDEGCALFDQITAGRTGEEPLFRKSGDGRWRRSNQFRPFGEACRRAEINPPASFHVLRHTYASLAIMNGAPPMVIAGNLGHSDTRMVEKHYGHLSQKFVTETIREKAPTFGMVQKSNVTKLQHSV